MVFKKESITLHPKLIKACVLATSLGALPTLSQSAFATDPFGSVYGEEEFITIATGTKQNARKAPAIVTVIDQEEIAHSSARTLEELLERVAGIHVSVSAAGYTPNYYIRGIGNDFNRQALTMINDVPISLPYNGDQGVAWTHMPLSVIEKIEIVRGPGSVLYGADAYAGVINIITKNTEPMPPSIKLGLGSYNTKTISGQQNLDFHDWQLGITFEAGQTDGFDEIIESDLQSTFDQLQNTNVSHAPGPVNAARKWVDLWMQLREGNWLFDLGYQGRYDVEEVIGWFGTLDNDGYHKNEELFLSAKYSSTFANESTLSHHFSVINSILDTSISLLPEGNAVYQYGLKSQLGFKEVIARYNTAYDYPFGDKHNLRFGVNTSFSRLYDIYENKNFYADQTPTPNGEIIYQDSSDPNLFLSPVNRRNIGIYAQDQYQVNEKSEFTFGVRFDHYNDFGNTTNPRAAWVYQLSDTVTSKVLYGTAFLSPSIYQLYAKNNPVRLGNSELEPETIKTLEGSLIFQLDQDEELSINIFQNRRDSIIKLVNGQYQNDGRQKGVGLEVEYKNDITNLWSIRGNMSFVRSIDSDTNTQAAFVPQKQFFLESLWRLNPTLSINMETYFIADRARTADDVREDIPDDTIVNFSALYEPFDSEISMKFGITNFFDSETLEPTSFNPAGFTGLYFPENDMPLPGRQVFAEVRWDY